VFVPEKLFQPYLKHVGKGQEPTLLSRTRRVLQLGMFRPCSQAWKGLPGTNTLAY